MTKSNTWMHWNSHLMCASTKKKKKQNCLQLHVVARIFLPHFLSTLGESKCSSPSRFLYYLFNGILKVCQCYHSDIVKDLVCTSGIPKAF